jgi:hypothetical protein
MVTGYEVIKTFVLVVVKLCPEEECGMEEIGLGATLEGAELEPPEDDDDHGLDGEGCPPPWEDEDVDVEDRDVDPALEGHQGVPGSERLDHCVMKGGSMQSG